MKVIRIIVIILVSVGIAFILACSEEKTASLEGNEDIVAVLQKTPKTFEDSEIINEIYTDDAIVKEWDGFSGRLIELRGLKQIENYRKEKGKVWRRTGITISSIEKKADTAHVEYKVDYEEVVSGGERGALNKCSAEMQKIGPIWKIKEEIDR